MVSSHRLSAMRHSHPSVVEDVGGRKYEQQGKKLSSRSTGGGSVGPPGRNVPKRPDLQLGYDTSKPGQNEVVVTRQA